ncbi:MAG TPA: FAD-dependent oxidoreductase [Azospirillaceae bacterium]|nr:FAD-dependent oxidoreductase [Azospirillaceae bacterium]
MHREGHGTTSLWMDTGRMPQGDAAMPRPAEPAHESDLDMPSAAAFAPFSLVNREQPADVVVVGAGIAGMTTAYLLAREGREVLVVDMGPAGRGQTGRTTAHLSNAFDDRYYELERMRGADAARLAADSHTAAIAMIERIAREEGIDCDFRRVDGYLMLAPETDPSELEQELAAAHRAGLAGVARVDDFALPGGQRGPALRFPDQGQFHPLKYLEGLRRAIEARGGRLVSGQRVEKVEGGEYATLHLAGGGSLRATACVVATNSPFVDKVAIHTKQAPYRTYVVGLRIPGGTVAPTLWWDTLEEYHYVRLQPAEDGSGDDILIVGGEDHKTGEAHDMEERFARLEAWARERWPQAGARAYSWSGQVMEPFDGLAFIGRDPANTANILIATGDSGMGMTHGTIAGMLLTDLLQGRDNPWAGLYDPDRKMGSNLKTYLRENLDVAKEFVREHLGGGEVTTESAIAPGCGGVVTHHGKKVAVYRAEDGMVQRVSAVCTHLGCIVHWNELERCWDCPCHGSQFATDGSLLNGPAPTPLGRVEG